MAASLLTRREHAVIGADAEIEGKELLIRRRALRGSRGNAIALMALKAPMDRNARAEIRQGEGVLAVAAVHVSEERIERGIVADLDRAAVARQPEFGNGLVGDQTDLSQQSFHRH